MAKRRNEPFALIHRLKARFLGAKDLKNDSVTLPEREVTFDRRVSARDVALSYQLFLGRGAESEAVLHERSGQLATEMLNGFVNSEEFRIWSVKVIDTSEDIARPFLLPASEELVGWAPEFLSLDASETRQFENAKSLLQTMSVVLGAPILRHVIDGAHGVGEAARLSGAIGRAAVRRTAETGALVTSAEDIRNLYVLTLDRLPESPAAAAPRDIPLFTVAADFIASNEFTAKIIPAAQNGRLGGRIALSLRLRAWIRDAFGITLDERASQQDAIVELLKQEKIVARLQQATLLWSPPAVVEALTITRNEEEDADTVGSSLLALLEASDLFDPGWYTDHNPDVNRIGDPLQHFLNQGAAEGRDPGPGFDTAFYLEQNPQVAAAKMPPLEHYLRIGRAAGAVPFGHAPYVRWAARFDALTEADQTWIGNDSADAALPRVSCLYLVPAGDEPNVTNLQVSIEAQVGPAMSLRRVGESEGCRSVAQALDALCDGEILLLIAAPCRLRSHTSYVFAKVLTTGSAEVAYSDHDHFVPTGERQYPVFKPAMSPDFMRRLPYAGPVVAVRLGSSNRSLVIRAMEQAATGNGVAAFAELLLANAPERVAHVPLPLYSLDIRSRTEPCGGTLWYEPLGVGVTDPVRIEHTDWPEVCLLIPTRDHRELLRACIDSIFATTSYPADRFCIVVIDNDTREADSRAYLKELAQHPRCRVVPSFGPFNFAKICNDGAAATDAEILVFLNNDMTVRDPEWLTMLVTEAVRPEIGIVGAQLLYPDNTVQHGGIVLGVKGFGEHRLTGIPVHTAAHLDVTREMTTMTGACLAVKHALFDAVGGFDTILGVAFNDVALCIRVAQAGYRNLYIARPLLYHHESKSRGSDDTEAKVARNLREAIYTRERFRQSFQDDPFYSPNLSLQKAGALAFPPRVVRPWRRTLARHVLLLSGEQAAGGDVGRVVAAQAAQFLKNGWTVTIGSPSDLTDDKYFGCRRVALWSAGEAAAFAVAEGVACIIAHTAPFFAVAGFLGRRPLFYIHDHGTPSLCAFGDPEAAAEAMWKKRFYAPFAERVFTVSQTVCNQQYRRDAIVVPNGNDDRATWTSDWTDRRILVRNQLGFEGRFVVLTQSHLDAAARGYERINEYARLAAETRYVSPALADRIKFVMIDQGGDGKIAIVHQTDVEFFAFASDEMLSDMYAAADLYVGLSSGDGYDFGLAQALAMGVEAIASNTAAHREFGIETADSVPGFHRLIADAFSRWDHAASRRIAHLVRWEVSLATQIAVIEKDLVDDAARSWL